MIISLFSLHFRSTVKKLPRTMRTDSAIFIISTIVLLKCSWSMTQDLPIDDTTEHPDSRIVKCLGRMIDYYEVGEMCPIEFFSPPFYSL